MTFLRHAGRHIHKTLADHLSSQLTALGWMDPDTTPYGATPVTLITRPVVMGNNLDRETVTAGLVAVTLGDEQLVDMQELGGPLAAQGYPFFVDVFGDNDAIATALATDIRDILLGRFTGSARWLRVLDGATGAVVPDWLIEIDDVERVRPETTQPVFWQTVKFTATTYFPEVVY
jgi:hypothetical protein